MNPFTSSVSLVATRTGPAGGRRLQGPADDAAVNAVLAGETPDRLAHQVVVPNTLEQLHPAHSFLLLPGVDTQEGRGWRRGVGPFQAIKLWMVGPDQSSESRTGAQTLAVEISGTGDRSLKRAGDPGSPGDPPMPAMR